ncbi:hypothetical protein AVEN_51248-1, partial [Araneus ventricosus]
KKIFRSREQYL